MKISWLQAAEDGLSFGSGRRVSFRKLPSSLKHLSDAQNSHYCEIFSNFPTLLKIQSLKKNFKHISFQNNFL